jgi:hypothetical protein
MDFNKVIFKEVTISQGKHREVGEKSSKNIESKNKYGTRSDRAGN